jgi:transposase-like protein
MKPTGNKPDLERRMQIQQLYQSGLTLRQIGAQLGITYQAVYAMLKRSGFPRRPRGGATGSHSRHKK